MKKIAIIFCSLIAIGYLAQAQATTTALPTPPATFSSPAACAMYVQDNYTNVVSGIPYNGMAQVFFNHFAYAPQPPTLPASQHCANNTCSNFIDYENLMPVAGGCALVGTQWWNKALGQLQQEVQMYNANNQTSGLRLSSYGFYGPSDKCTFEDTSYKNCILGTMTK